MKLNENVEIFHGDCLNVMPTLTQKFHAIITDIPYGTTKCKWDAVIPFVPMWKQIKRLLDANAATLLFGSEPFSSLLRISNLKEFKYDWTWDKVTARGHLVAKYRPLQQTEIISVFGMGRVNYYPIMIDRPPNKVRKTREYKRTEIMGGNRKELKEKVYDQWYPKTLITLSNARSSVKSVHPTQKLVELMEYFIKTYSRRDEIILDFAMGSGTTGVACINTGRKFVGIEKEKKYFDIAKERLKSVK